MPNLETLDLVRIFVTPDIKDLISNDGINQLQRILAKFDIYYKNNPSILLVRSAEGDNNISTIYNLIYDRMIAEAAGLSKSQLDQFDNYLKPIKSLFGF